MCSNIDKRLQAEGQQLQTIIKITFAFFHIIFVKKIIRKINNIIVCGVRTSLCSKEQEEEREREREGDRERETSGNLNLI